MQPAHQQQQQHQQQEEFAFHRCILCSSEVELKLRVSHFCPPSFPPQLLDLEASGVSTAPQQKISLPELSAQVGGGLEGCCGHTAC